MNQAIREMNRTICELKAEQVIACQGLKAAEATIAELKAIIAAYKRWNTEAKQKLEAAGLPTSWSYSVSALEAK